jgi:hypothetical protein
VKRTGFDPDSFRPYPELVEPDRHTTPYRIRDAEREPGLGSRGAVDRKQRRMWVPLRETGRSVARHELGHTRFSPVVLPRVSFEPGVLAAVEDARVNLALLRSGVPSDLDFESEATVVMLAARDLRDGDPFALFQRAVASIGTSVRPVLAGILAREETPLGAAILGWAGRVERALVAAAERRGHAEAPFETGLALARRLARELRAWGLLDADGHARTPSVIRCCIADGEKLLGEWGVGPRGRSGDEEEASETGVAPGRLTIHALPRPVRRRGRGAMRSGGPGAEGSVVRYPSRWATDRAVFRRRARSGGATVLVDASGSMPIAAPDLDRFLLEAPVGARVAAYAGHRDAGELRIVADGGRRAVAESLGGFGRGNIVDLPALEWLARQRRPRLWVSDGGVTGVGDRACAILSARCAAVRRRARIRRVSSLEEAGRLLAAGRRSC